MWSCNYYKCCELLCWISLRIINALRSYLSSTQKSVSSDIRQTLWSWALDFSDFPVGSISNSFHSFVIYFEGGLKKLGCFSFFQPTFQCLDICWNTLASVWYITSNIYQSTCNVYCFFRCTRSKSCGRVNTSKATSIWPTFLFCKVCLTWCFL